MAQWGQERWTTFSCTSVPVPLVLRCPSGSPVFTDQVVNGKLWSVYFT